MRQKAPTIRDVAERARVSVSTVSHVLNGNDGHVSPAVRQRVLEVVEDLKYRPNAIARSMVKRKTATIGLVFNEIENSLFVPVIDGVNEVLQPAGYHMVLASAPDVQGEIEAIDTLPLVGRVDVDRFRSIRCECHGLRADRRDAARLRAAEPAALPARRGQRVLPRSPGKARRPQVARKTQAGIPGLRSAGRAAGPTPRPPGSRPPQAAGGGTSPTSR